MKSYEGVIGCLIGLLLAVRVGADPLVEGRVQLPSGEPAVGVQVRLFDLADLRQGVVAGAVTDGAGHFSLRSGALAASVLPEGFSLGSNYPNPFNPSTMIPYQLPAPMHVRLEVFNLLGQRIATLVDGGRAAGSHTAEWDATDAAGQAVGAGVYLYRLSGDGARITRRMLLIDGQAGIASGVRGPTVREESVETARVYGLTVSGPGLVPYVDPAFRVEPGMAPLDLVLEAPGSAPSAKVASGGILGDVDNSGVVSFFDALLVALYSQDPNVVLPLGSDIWLGDVDDNGVVTIWDAFLIAVWLEYGDPTHGIGEPVGPAASLSPDPSTVSFAADGTWHRFTVEAGEPLAVVANPAGTLRGLEITTRSGQGNFCPAEAEDDVARRDGQTLYLSGCAEGQATVELRRASDGTVLRTYTFTVTSGDGDPDLVVASASVSDNTLTPGQSFTLRATVRNQGTGRSAATTLRYYRSSNSTISTGDRNVGSDPVSALAAAGTSAESISLTAPSSERTWYYGACVVSVDDESDEDNNCSSGVRVTVAAPRITKMYWTNVRDDANDQIQRANLDGSRVETLATGPGSWRYGAIALDVSVGKMYWTIGGTETVRGFIERANLDGSRIETLVTGLEVPSGIALDASAGKMYWTNLRDGNDQIQRANLDGSRVETLVTRPWPLGDIALDVSAGKMYWTEHETETVAGSIHRANLNGSRVETLVTGLEVPFGIALDASAGKMYWTNLRDGNDQIQRANLDGSRVETLVTRPWPLGDIALDVSAGKMYWTEHETETVAGSIHRANLNGSRVEDLVTALEYPLGLALGPDMP